VADSAGRTALNFGMSTLIVECLLTRAQDLVPSERAAGAARNLARKLRCEPLEQTDGAVDEHTSIG
jgi:hypothetical protein